MVYADDHGPRVQALLVDINGDPIISDDGLQVVGNEAHDAADSGNPVKTGGHANTGGIRAAVGDGDRVDSSYDLVGHPGTTLWHPDATTPLSSATGAFVQGAIAHDSSSSARPVPIGGIAETGTPGAVGDGDAVQARFDEYGNQGVFIGTDGSGSNTAYVNMTDSDGYGGQNSLFTWSQMGRWIPSASAWARARGHYTETILASATRTATTSSSALTQVDSGSLYVWMSVTGNPGGGETLEVRIQISNPLNGLFRSILEDAANTYVAASQRLFLVTHGYSSAAADVSKSESLPLTRTMRVQVVHSAAGSWVYNVVGFWGP